MPDDSKSSAVPSHDSRLTTHGLSDVVISVKNLSKKYSLYDSPQHRLKEALHPFRKKYHREFWALNDVSFEVRKGETIGIMGKNGSGKSTLLQIICGVLQPSQGDVKVNGRISALLELGAGFNPEFTGRENVYMNGAIKGFTREEMDEKFQAIGDFADIGDFIDQPVKTYSSGMYVRLAFAVGISVDPDILIIDEALAVGDVFFRQKCYKRLGEFRERGVPIILVSHAMGEVEQFCQRALLLDKGNVIFEGSSAEAVQRYLLREKKGIMDKLEQKNNSSVSLQTALHQEPKEEYFWPPQEAFFDISQISQVSNGWARCTGVALCNAEGQPCRNFQQGERATFFYEFELLHDIEVPIGGLVIKNDRDIIVHGKNTLEYGSRVPSSAAKGSRLRFRHEISLELEMGEYTFFVGLATIGHEDYGSISSLAQGEIDARVLRLCHLPTIGIFSVGWRKEPKPVFLLHHGVCNLPGDCEVFMTAPPDEQIAQSASAPSAKEMKKEQEGRVEMMRIVVAEYPKSGVVWLTSMLGDALSLPKRDIDVSEGHTWQDLTKHPWYEGAQSLNLTASCVIKSHELPDSPKHNFPARYVHMLRDGRDVVVSRYYFDKDFLVKNGLAEELTMSFDEYVEKRAAEWAAFVRAWEEKRVVTCRYEVLLADTFSALQQLFSQLGLDVPPERILDSIQKNNKENMRKALGRAYKHNTFVRKGIVGDWKNHFSNRHKEIFKKQTGTLLIDLGYEDNEDW